MAPRGSPTACSPCRAVSRWRALTSAGGLSPAPSYRPDHWSSTLSRSRSAPGAFSRSRSLPEAAFKENDMDQTQEMKLTVRRRDGSVVAFDRSRIERAIASAFLRDANGEPRHVGGNDLMPAEREKVERFTEQIVHALSRRPD